MKKWIIGIGLVVLLLVVFVVVRGIYGDTKINGVSYNLTCSDKQLVNKLENTSQKSYFVNDDLEKQFVKYQYDVSPILGHSTAKKFFDNLVGKEYNVDYTKEFLKDDFISYLDEYNASKTESKDAYIYKEENEYKVEPEVSGDQVNVEEVLNNIEDGKVIDINDYIIHPNVLEDDLTQTVEEMNEYNAWYVTYTNGNKIAPSEDSIVLNEDNTYSVSDSFIDEQIRSAVKSYVTVGEPKTFQCSDGVIRDIGGGTWGTNVNYADEVAFLKEQFQKKESVDDRTPEFSINYTDIGNTFVEVSIEKQHLWFYRDGVLVVEADVITGLPNGKRNTPTGVYYISECIKGKYLVGENYRTWVNYWMRLTNNGVGFHDAGWQSAFGGDLYLTKGSHGCINLAPDFAAFLFSQAYRGMPAIIY